MLGCPIVTPIHFKPPIAAWIVRERRARGWKPRDVAAHLEAMGLDVSEATVKVWESNVDRRPNAYNLEGLERIFDSKAPSPEPLTEQEAVAAAIDRNTDAIKALAERLGDLLHAEVERERARGEWEQGVMEALLDLVRRDGGSAPEPVSRDTAPAAARGRRPARAQ